MNGERPVPLRGLLSMVRAMGGALESRIRLQKAVYLFKRVGVADFRGTSFRYHNYGPYSRPLSDTVQDAVVSGLLREVRKELGEEMSKYTYELTPRGKAWLEENGASEEGCLDELAPLFAGSAWRSMELAATALFLEEDERLTRREEAMEHALQLKPACVEHREEAEALLARVQTHLG